jgi:hypothetical protein
MLQVKWSNGMLTWEPETPVKLDVPQMLKKFNETMSQSSPSRKGRLEFAIERRGGCNNEHTCEHFMIEEDPRYWNEGHSFHGVNCGKCGRPSRPSAKVPSYCCTQWNTQGCLELRCGNCYSNMLTSEEPDTRSRRRGDIIVNI